MGSVSNFTPRPSRNRRRWILRLENILLIVGLLALAYYGGARLYSSAYQAYEKYSFEKQLNGQSPSTLGFLRRMLGKEEAPAIAKKPKPGETITGEELLKNMIYAPEMIPTDKGWSADRLRAFKNAPNPPPGAILGRLEIPSLDLSVMLLSGTDDWTLNRAVGHIEGTAFPGQPGNLGIAGHRDGFFRSLKDIQKDTVIELTTLKGRFIYRVNGIHIVKPRDVHLLAPTLNPTITLVTCYPFHYVGDAPKRYVVTAEIVKVQGANEVAAEYSRSD